jgi:hypothetical protein
MAVHHKGRGNHAVFIAGLNELIRKHEEIN